MNFTRLLVDGLGSIGMDSSKHEATKVGLLAAFTGAAAGVAFGLPLAAVAVSAGAAGVGAGVTNKLSGVFIDVAFDEAGLAARLFGLVLNGFAKVVAVPVAAVAAARYSLKATGFVP